MYYKMIRIKQAHNTNTAQNCTTYARIVNCGSARTRTYQLFVYNLSLLLKLNQVEQLLQGSYS